MQTYKNIVELRESLIACKFYYYRNKGLHASREKRLECVNDFEDYITQVYRELNAILEYMCKSGQITQRQYTIYKNRNKNLYTIHDDLCVELGF